MPKTIKKTPFERFRRMAQRIVAVPKQEVDELRQKTKKATSLRALKSK